MKRLTTWPSHRLTLAIAACVAVVTGLNAADGDLDWSVWTGSGIVALLLALALKEKRRGD